MRATHSVQELRHLIGQLERSGLAMERPEARALLERSRRLLRQRKKAPRHLGAKMAALLGFAMDAALLAALPILATLLLAGEAGGPALAFVLLAPGWVLFRLRRHVHWLAEAARWLGYHLAWGWDWVAEAFSLRAMDRLEARLHAREFMWGWRRHRSILPRRASLDDVAGFLTLEYGPQAASAFRRAAAKLDEARAWTLRGGQRRYHASERLAALRWSALIGVFGQLAASGALWTGFQEQAAPLAPNPGEAAPDPPPAETAEHAARRADLRDLIRRKRHDITAAFGWKLKTAAEIAQRDVHLAQLRAEIAALEQELGHLG